MDVPVPGGLTYLDRARIANWFEIHIAKDRQIRHRWITSLPMAHAITIVLAYQFSKEKHGIGNHLTTDNLRTTWEHQNAATDKGGIGIDVDKESLGLLEERMFEQSFRAGIAGHRQWGLDAGDHQECWDPYKERPKGWVHSDYKGDENELLVRQAANSLSAPELMSPHQLGPKYVYLKPPQDEKHESHSQPSRRGCKQGKKTRGKKWN